MKTSNRTIYRATLENVTHYQNAPDAHPRPQLIDNKFELIEVMTGGRGWIEDAGEWREVLPGDIIWNQRGDFTIGRSDFKNPYRCLSVRLATTRRRPVPRFSHWPDIRSLRAFTDEVVALFRRETFDRAALGDHILAQLLFRIQLRDHQNREEELPIPLREVLAVIDREYARPCRIAELAQVAGWSPAHLHEVFQQRLNLSPHQWLIRRRLQAAREALESSLQPIKQISAECGFTDTAAFTHGFKAGVGLTPTEYRKRYLRQVAA